MTEDLLDSVIKDLRDDVIKHGRRMFNAGMLAGFGIGVLISVWVWVLTVHT